MIRIHANTRQVMDEGKQVNLLYVYVVTDQYLFKLARSWRTDGTVNDRGEILSSFDRESFDFNDPKKYTAIHPLYEPMAKEMARGYIERLKHAAIALSTATS